MDQDSYRPVYQTVSKTYFSNRNQYPDYPIKSNQSTYHKQQSQKVSYKKSQRSGIQNSNMNQLAPRFQQRAIYSQYYRTDYESSWRANLLAASYRSQSKNKNPVAKIINLGERPDPEGAPSYKVEETEPTKEKIDYERVLNNDVWLYSDYGSDSDDHSELEDSNSIDGENKIPNSSWSTASLLSHAFNKTSSNKITIMSYAVIGAELNSITKLHSSKTEVDLSTLTKKTLRLTENIDNARKSLKDIALGLRSLKQEIKSKTRRCSNNRDKLLKHSAASLLSHSDLSFTAEETDKRFNKKKSTGQLDKLTLPQDSSNLANYCTIDRRHKVRSSSNSHHHSDPRFAMIKYMNLDVVNKRSSSDEY